MVPSQPRCCLQSAQRDRKRQLEQLWSQLNNGGQQPSKVVPLGSTKGGQNECQVGETKFDVEESSLELVEPIELTNHVRKLTSLSTDSVVRSCATTTSECVTFYSHSMEKSMTFEELNNLQKSPQKSQPQRGTARSKSDLSSTSNDAFPIRQLQTEDSVGAMSCLSLNLSADEMDYQEGGSDKASSSQAKEELKQWENKSVAFSRHLATSDSMSGFNALEGIQEEESLHNSRTLSLPSMNLGSDTKHTQTSSLRVRMATRSSSKKLSRNLSKQSGQFSVYSSDSWFDADVASDTGDDDAHKGGRDPAQRRMRRTKIIFVLLLTIIGVTSTLIAYLFSQQDYEDDLATKTFSADAKLYYETTVQRNMQEHLTSVEWFASSIQFQASKSSSDWPLITIENFEKQADLLRRRIHAESVALVPVVTEKSKKEWEEYSVINFQNWMDESLAYIDSKTNMTTPIPNPASTISPVIFTEGATDIGSGPFLPMWQLSPPNADASFYNLDTLTHPELMEGLSLVLSEQKAIFSDISSAKLGVKSDNYQNGEALSVLLYPIIAGNSDSKETVGVLLVTQRLSTILDSNLRKSLVPVTSFKAVCVVKNTQTDKEYLYKIDHGLQNDGTSPAIMYLGEGKQLHYDSDSIQEKFPLIPNDNNTALSSSYGLDVIQVLSEPVDSSYIVYASIYVVPVIGCFAILLCFFLSYDYMVGRRHHHTSRYAAQYNALVHSIFPEEVHERLLKNNSFLPGSNFSTAASNVSANKSTDESDDGAEGAVQEPPKLRLRSLLRSSSTRSFGSQKNGEDNENMPIADYFPDCTIMFADVVGFTAWSSTRDPTQVFTLLQCIFQEFDQAAKKRGVFKVETIGDSYVAVTGLPQPNEDHALVMAAFALECRKLMKEVTNSLHPLLGPDTADLKMRFGLHSGPVTAGVLQGAKARFQLFGDTMNTASRMESNGKPNQIQISGSTAALLEKAGKGDWTKQREEKVKVKGKGEMQTFWLDPQSRNNRRARRMSAGAAYQSFAADNPSLNLSTRNIEGMSTSSKAKDDIKLDGLDSWGNSDLNRSVQTLSSESSLTTSMDGFDSRLIEWNVNILVDLLKKVVARRKTDEAKSKTRRGSTAFAVTHEDEELFLSENVKVGKTVVEEVTEVIKLPDFEEEAVVDSIDPETIELDYEVINQLRDYVSTIAGTYRDNPFHNYEHACHVQMSMLKLLQRVTTPEQINYSGQKAVVASDAHDYTYGIASDPLTQFTVIFCGLIHDVDHAGVNNGQLVKENAYIASLYQEKSVAEQNSIDIAWGVLMSPEFNELRQCIYANKSEFIRFRQLVVNVVLATDIFDKELSALRKNRWNTAFYDIPKNDSPSDHVNRKATIVIEHLIQASDVAHTMQHWNIYKKWNERLFREMMSAYLCGRIDADPSEGWYKGEIWFFDNYVIPLAKKLNDCSVFGVSSEECLTYARENRARWEVEGEKIVEDMLASKMVTKLKTQLAAEKRFLEAIEKEDTY